MLCYKPNDKMELWYRVCKVVCVHKRIAVVKPVHMIMEKLTHAIGFALVICTCINSVV